MPNSPIASSELFSGISPEALDQLRDAAKELNFSRGEVLLRQGELASELYFIQSGRFKVVVGGERTVAHLDAGEVVGELAFFAGGERTADVIATRDATVLEITRRDYDVIASQHRELPQLLLRLVSERLAQTTQRTQAIQQNIPRVIGLLPIGSTQMPPHFPEQLAETMRSTQGMRRDVRLAREDVVDSVEQYSKWLADTESEGGFILVDCTGSPSWVEHASRNVDALLLVAEDNAEDKSISAIESQATDLLSAHNRNLVILHPKVEDEIVATGDWLDPRNLGLHHHVGLNSEASIARLARFLCGTANGLILAGGGALGCAHLGILKALQNHNIPIDFLGGASAGAAMAGAVASGLTPDETIDQMEEMFVAARALKRLTIPVHSLLDPREFDHQLQTRYGFGDIADLATQFFAVSTNLSSGSQQIHRRGPLWEAVRASGSLPTILPPFIDSNGNILVDGGVLDNLPVNVMTSLKQGPNIAVALDALDEDWQSEARYDQIRGRGALLRDILLRRKPTEKFPTLFETTQRSMVVTSRIAARDIDGDNNIVLTAPRIEGMQILDWHRGRELADLAERTISELIDKEPEKFNLLRGG